MKVPWQLPNTNCDMSSISLMVLIMFSLKWSLLFIRNANHIVSITPHTPTHTVVMNDFVGRGLLSIQYVSES